MSLKKRRG